MQSVCTDMLHYRGVFSTSQTAVCNRLTIKSPIIAYKISWQTTDAEVTLMWTGRN